MKFLVKVRGADEQQSARGGGWRRRTKKTLDVLTKDPHFADNLAQATAVGNSTDRIPQPSSISGQVYNFWQDAEHVRGIWRAHHARGLRAGRRPAWTTVLDLDALADGREGELGLAGRRLRRARPSGAA